jgi:predicted RNA-binding Zn-ribbon protein involved in translation (DUF1610 family)
MKAPQPNCPYCGTKMIPGTASVHGTFWGFLLFGLSHQHLWFRSGSLKSGEEKIIVGSGDERAAHSCPACGAVSIHTLTRGWSN